MSKVAWIDIDTKMVGSLSKAYAYLNDSTEYLPCPPSIIVKTGNGLHAYWILDKPLKSTEALESLNFYIAQNLGGDTAWDGPRVLRMPGTLNVKHPGSFEEVKVVDLNNNILPVDALGSILKADTHKAKNRVILRNPNVQTDLSSVSPIFRRYIEEGISADTRGYYFKQGKPDKSSLDFAVVLELLRKGYEHENIVDVFTDPSNGISEKTLGKGHDAMRYLELTIRKAEECLCPEERRTRT